MQTKNAEVLKEIIRQKESGIQPTCSTLLVHFGIREQTVSFHIHKLVRSGKIYFDENHQIILHPSEVVLSKTHLQVIELDKEHNGDTVKVARLLGVSTMGVLRYRQTIARKLDARDLRIAAMVS